jgi:glycosyltransferase involved in cell wall biosynthesis
MTDIQIIIPTYNRANTILDTIDSIILSASNYDFVIKIIDNASTDDTHALVSSTYQQLIREKIIILQCFKENVPMVENWNRCISSIGPATYTKLLWSDDCLDPEYFDKKIKLIKHGGCDVVGCNLRIVQQDLSKAFNRHYGGNFIKIQSLFRNRIGYPSTLLFKTNIIKNKFFDNEIPYSADIDHILNLIKSGAKFYHLDSVLVEAKQNGSTETSKFFASDEMKNERKKYRIKHIKSGFLNVLANMLDNFVLKVYVLSKSR